MNEISCVTFDLDDTLFLEREYVRSGFRAAGDWVRDHLGCDDFDRRVWHAFERGVRGSIFDDVLTELGVGPDPELIHTLVELYRAHEPDVALLPDAAAAIGVLARSTTLAVVTDGPPTSQRAKARALHTDEWARATIITGELGPGFGKPHPHSFQLVEHGMACSGRACVYVADNPAKDFGGPQHLGWRTIRVRRRGSLHEDVPSGDDVELELPDLVDLPERLAGLHTP